MRASTIAVATCALSACVALADKQHGRPADGLSSWCEGDACDGGAVRSFADAGHDARAEAGADAGRDAQLEASANDAGHVFDAGTGFLHDAYAPLPPPPEGTSFNAIYVAHLHRMYLPLFSTPSCNVVPPYGESYSVGFTPTTAGPIGTFPACTPSNEGTPCYQVGRDETPENLPGGRYALSAFDAESRAIGVMDTAEGLVRLDVKLCP